MNKKIITSIAAGIGSAAIVVPAITVTSCSNSDNTPIIRVKVNGEDRDSLMKITKLNENSYDNKFTIDSDLTTSDSDLNIRFDVIIENIDEIDAVDMLLFQFTKLEGVVGDELIRQRIEEGGGGNIFDVAFEVQNNQITFTLSQSFLNSLVPSDDFGLIEFKVIAFQGWGDMGMGVETDYIGSVKFINTNER